jgi:hypothetical protein
MPVAAAVPAPLVAPSAGFNAVPVADALPVPDAAPSALIVADPSPTALAVPVPLASPTAVVTKLLVTTVDALARKSTSALLLPPAVVVSHSHWTNKYSPLNVIAAPGINVTVDVASALVDSAAVVVPVRTAPVNCVALEPLALTDFQIRHLTRPACDDALVTARTRNVSVQLALTNSPVIVFSDRQLSPPVGAAAVPKASVVLKLVAASSLP